MSCLLATINLADHGTVYADSAAASLPAALLQGPHIVQVWRSIVTPTWLRSDLGASQIVDVVALVGFNATMASEIRVRIGDDPDFATASYDSGPLTGVCDPKYKQFVDVLTEPVVGRYVRIDMADASLDYFEAGRLFIGLGFRPKINFSFGAGRSVVSLSQRSQSYGGQIYTDRRGKQRRWSFTLSSLAPEEAEFIERFDVENATDADVLFCAFVTSSNLSRDTLFGYLDTSSEIADRAFRLSSKPFVIMERR